MFQIGIFCVTCKNLVTFLPVTALHTFLCAFMGEHTAFYLPEHEFYKRGRFRSTLTPVDYVRIWYVRSTDVRCSLSVRSWPALLRFRLPVRCCSDCRGSIAKAQAAAVEREIQRHQLCISGVIFKVLHIFQHYSDTCICLDRTTLCSLRRRDF